MMIMMKFPITTPMIIMMLMMIAMMMAEARM